MATETVTTVTYRCDLCGTARKPDELVKVYGPPDAANSRPAASCDICPDCRDRPVSEVLDWLAKAAKVARAAPVAARLMPDTAPVRAAVRPALGQRASTDRGGRNRTGRDDLGRR